MPIEEPIQNLPAPINSDPPDGPTQIAAVNAAVVDRLNMRFASVAARDAALPNPVDGMEATTGSGPSAVKWIYVNGEWVRQAIGRINKITIDVPGAEGWASGGSVTATRTANGMVTVNVNKEWGTAGYGASLGTLPPGYDPAENVYVSAVTGVNFGANMTAGASLRIALGGGLVAYAASADRSSFFRASISYPAADAT